jgi:hypothetical protein
MVLVPKFWYERYGWGWCYSEHQVNQRREWDYSNTISLCGKGFEPFGYKDSKPSPTPYDLILVLRKNKRIGRDQLRYSHIIWSLVYVASATKPDILFVVSKLSWFTSNLRDDHWHALERVMHYLASTMDYGIHYSWYPTVLEGYSDANWISDMDELYAMSGYVFTLGGTAVSWRSCK